MPSTVTTPIERAIARGDFETFSDLLSEVEDLDAIATARGDTLLGRACAQTSGQKFTPGHRRIIDTLLERGADPHKPARNGLTALGLAAWHGDWQCIATLFDAGVEIQTWTEVLCLADERRFLGTLAEDPGSAWRICSEAGWERHGSWTPVDVLGTSRMWRCDIELVKKRGKNRVLAAQAAGSEEPGVGARMARMVSTLLDHTTPSETNRQHCLDFAVRCATGWGSEEVAQVLLDAGADPSTAFDKALIAGRIAILERLPASSYDVDGRDSDSRRSPWIVTAMRAGSVAAVCWLLDHGADPSQKDDDGGTALDYALRRKVPEDLLERLRH